MKKKILLSSILSIMLCLSLITGATFALFTSESKVNVAVTSGNVDVVATVEDLTLSSTLAAGNLAETTVNAQDNTITLDKIVPGDVVTFNLRIKNNSDVTIKYRTAVTKVSDNGLWNGLEVTIDGTVYAGNSKVSVWETAAPGSADIIVPVKVTLPESAGNEYESKTCTIAYTVEAVQGNANVTDAPAEDNPASSLYYTVATAEELLALAGTTMPSGATIDIVSDIDLGGAELPAIAANGSLVVNGNANTISNPSIKTPGTQNGMDNYGMFYVFTDATLTVSDLVVENAVVETAGTNYGAAVLVGYADGNSTVNFINVDVKNSSVTNAYDEAAIYVSYTTSKVNMTGCDAINCTVAGEDTVKKTAVGIGHINGGMAVLTDCTEDNASFDWCHRIDGTLVVDGKYYVAKADGLSAALTSDAKVIDVVLLTDVAVDITTLGNQTAGSGEYKLGGENTTDIKIDLGGHKLTIETGYWSALGAKNEDATLTITNGSMTSSQASGTWNSYDLRFANCNVVLEDVVFDKAIALENVGKKATLTNVTINETHDYYALWITAEGQDVTIDGLTVNSAGRGIKIDEQYVGTPAKVTLSICNATFNTAKKAAILVKSVEGADITVGANVDIANVAADAVNTVWVDADSAAYASLVTVTGATCIVEQ